MRLGVEIIGVVGGLIIILTAMVVSIRLLRQPKRPYLGDPEPQERRWFRDTMFFWMSGPRS
jgi:hypothetical protein